MPTAHFTTTGDTRSLRGLHIAINADIQKTSKGFIVPSQTTSSKYVVTLDLSECSCTDYEQRQAPCKHIYAVQHTLEGFDETVEAPRVSKPTYPQK